MNELISSGRVVDFIIGCMLVEWVALAWYTARTGKGIAPRALTANFLAGILLMLALRGALITADWKWIALCLAAALPAHMADLAQRWRQSEGQRRLSDSNSGSGRSHQNSRED